jgi:hypothetical protein
MAIVPLEIRWGKGKASEFVRRRARCLKCGNLGADISVPSYDNNGLCPMPIERAALAYEAGLSEILEGDMCTLYSSLTNQEAIRQLAFYMSDKTGNLQSLPAIFPDQLAPVVRTASAGERELTMMRWGFPPPPNLGKAPVVNVRNVSSPYWRTWLQSGYRCVVPATSFCEYDGIIPPKVPTWFALDDSRPLFSLPGSGGRGKEPAAPRRRRSRASTCSTHSSRPQRMRSSGRFIRRRCRSSSRRRTRSSAG